MEFKRSRDSCRPLRGNEIHICRIKIMTIQAYLPLS